MTASIAKAFVEARRTGAVIADYPGDIPAALDDAYEIQDSGIALTGKAVGGWKVGRIPADLIDIYGTNRLAGPIFSDQIIGPSDGAGPDMPVLDGFAAIEAELLMRIGRTPPPDLTLGNAPLYIDEVRFGLEVASSPFPGINDHGPAVTISDFGNNFGLVLGPRITDWQSRDLNNAMVSLSIDGAMVGSATLASMLDGPFGAVAFLNRLLQDRGIKLTVGTWISTGAITGVHRISARQSATAVFDDAFEVGCRTIAFAAPAANGVGGLK